MATNIPPHNLVETINATIAYIDDPDIETAGLMQHLRGPDFPTGGVILGLSGIRDAYETGRGRIRVRAKAHIEPLAQRSEEHTSELQSRQYLVCRLLLEKKK